MKQKLIVIAGPTASGKTGVGISLAKAINGEIISADSMQIYKDMPIATAAPTLQEQNEVEHHLVEFLDSDVNYSVASFCEDAKREINLISSKNKVPIIVGGTGLFIDSLIDNIQFEDVEIDYELRNKLMQKSVDELYDELLKLDKKAALEIHKNNKKRVVRALELCYSGTSKTTQNINSKKIESPYETLYFVLDYENRDELYSRINKRVDLMVKNGLVDEAKRNLSKENSSTSNQAIGHKELKPYFNGEITLENAVDNLKQSTRHYAKRQITWFKRREDAVRITINNNIEEQTQKIINISEDFLNG